VHSVRANQAIFALFLAVAFLSFIIKRDYGCESEKKFFNKNL